MQIYTNSTSNSLPWWALTIIALLGLVALILGCWGFWSALKIKTKPSSAQEEWSSHFQAKKVIPYNETSDEFKGIYALTFKGINYENYFHPVFVFATDNLKKTSQELIQKITSDSNNQIHKYMQNDEIDFKSIIYIELEPDADEEKLEHWINLLETKQRGFNA